jgi:hypothetical protein
VCVGTLLLLDHNAIVVYHTCTGVYNKGIYTPVNMWAGHFSHMHYTAPHQPPVLAGADLHAHARTHNRCTAVT